MNLEQSTLKCIAVEITLPVEMTAAIVRVTTGPSLCIWEVLLSTFAELRGGENTGVCPGKIFFWFLKKRNTFLKKLLRRKLHLLQEQK